MATKIDTRKNRSTTRTYEGFDPTLGYDPAKTFDEIQEQSFNLVRQGQEAVVEGVRAWSEVVGSLAPAWQATGWPVRPEEAVDAVFDIAEQTLATQRQVVRQIWGATASVAETSVKQAPAAAEEAPTAESTTDKGRGKDKDYESMTVEQLQDEAAKADIEGRSQMNKQELVKALRKHS